MNVEVRDSDLPGSQGPLLRARELDKSFGSSPALHALSMDVRQGEIVAVLGSSGSGKSTLLLCLGGIILPDRGDVFYRGSRLRQLSEGARTRLRLQEFGFIFQFGQLVPELTAIDNVSLPLRLAGLRRETARSRAGDWLERLNVDNVSHKRAGEMSGGEGQRVAVARALVTEPKVVFADEPTGALDSLNGEAVMESLVGAAREKGTTVVLVTHESRVAAYADREVVVRDGTVTRSDVFA